MRIPATAAMLLALTATAASAAEVNVYSYRQPFLIQPLFDAFTAETGTKVNVVFAKKGLVERLKSEGEAGPADLIFTVDIGRLAAAAEAGVVEPVVTPTLAANIPDAFRDPKGTWYGLTSRLRVVYASKERVAMGGLKTYEELADPKWRGKICTRSGKHVYNIALFASMIAHHGKAKAEEWLRGLKANLARKPQGNDRAQVKGVFAGECDLAVGNHYYFQKMMDNPEQRPWAESVDIVFPNNDGRGVHANISGASLVKGAPNRADAIALLEFLSSPKAQRMYAEVNGEYPVNPDVAIPKMLADLGTPKPDSLSLTRIAELRAEASRMVDAVNYND